MQENVNISLDNRIERVSINTDEENLSWDHTGDIPSFSSQVPLSFLNGRPTLPGPINPLSHIMENILSGRRDVDQEVLYLHQNE